MTTVTQTPEEESPFAQDFSGITAQSLGSAQFKADYGLRYAYITGSMFKGISSPEMLIALGRAGFMGYLGTGGMRYSNIEAAIHAIKSALPQNQPYGLNLLSSVFSDPYEEAKMVDLCLTHGVRYVEASTYMQVTLDLARYRLKGLRHTADGHIVTENHILAKISHPNVAEAFMRPIPEAMVKRLLETNQISREQAALSQHVPVSGDICVEADSGGHTSHGVAYVLMPAVQRLCEKISRRYNYTTPIRIGAAGGIGTPEAAAAAFILSVDFVLTGSINQCTTEASTSDSVKDLLQSRDSPCRQYQGYFLHYCCCNPIHFFKISVHLSIVIFSDYRSHQDRYLKSKNDEAFFRIRFHGKATMKCLCNLLGQGQPQSCSWSLIASRFIHPVKAIEDSLLLVQGDRGSRVFHVKN